MTVLATLKISAVDASPFRDLKRFPLNEENVADLMAKMSDSGILPATGGVVVRKKGERYQLAYGHHRMEALHRLGHKTFDVLVADVDDKHMVKYLASENKAIKNGGFVAQYESWLAAVSFLSPGTGRKPEAVSIAKFLGWVRTETKNGKDYIRASHLAKTCNNFTTLVAELSFDEIICLTWTNNTAQEMVSNAMSKRNELIQTSKRINATDDEKATAMARLAEANRRVAKKVNEGAVAPSRAKAELSKELHDVAMHHKDLKDHAMLQRLQKKEAVRAKKAADKKQFGPELPVAVKGLCTALDQVLDTDNIASRLDDMVRALDILQAEGHHGELLKLVSALEALAKRAKHYATTLETQPQSPRLAITGAAQ